MAAQIDFGRRGEKSYFEVRRGGLLNECRFRETDSRGDLLHRRFRQTIRIKHNPGGIPAPFRFGKGV
jgi:hypothetical protein